MVETTTTGRRAAQRGRPPYRQGDLDGLCGVYTIINAVSALAPAMTDRKALRLFDSLMGDLRQRDTGRQSLVVAGLNRRRLLQTLRGANRFAERELKGQLIWSRVPADVAARWSMKALWRLLDRRLSSDFVAVIGLDGRHDHWTLAVAVTDRTIKLRDSDGLEILRRSACSGSVRSGAPHLIDPGYVFFLRWRSDTV